MGKTASAVGWGLFGVFGAGCLAMLALSRGESVNAIWLVASAIAVMAIGYRFYSRFLVDRVLQVDPGRATPALRRNDGLDYVPTDRWVVFGHHFAAIAGAGPLVGPVLAAQMGYLPGTLWILVGVVLAGAVQDLMILFFSVRRDGRSLGEMIRSELGNGAGVIAMIGIFMILTLLLAVLALVVDKALAQSPWGTFTVAMTIPIAVGMGLYLRYIRPGRILEISAIGVVLLLAAIWLGGVVAANPAWAAWFTFDGKTLAWLLIGYGFIASVLPVWLVLAPRDYLSTFLKIGTVALLAIAVFVAMPELKMPAMTKFVDGSGPVFSGALFPFLFITIACGSVSGFHALVASGTTPKLLASEGDLRLVGYAGMLMEGFVAIAALVAACALDPGIYFAMNSPAALIGTDVTQAATTISSWGFLVTPEQLTLTAQQIGENTLLSRTGGAPTLAVGMAQILHELVGGGGMMAFWYHYAILFEALFILTTVDAGTRVARFMIQDLAGMAYAPLQRTDSWGANLFATAIAVGAWGYFLYQGVTDPLGGINSLWPLFGIANQMLAGMALTFCCVVLVKMKRERYLWVALVPAAWLLLCTLVAGWQKLFHADAKIGFLAAAKKFGDAAANGDIIAPAKTLAEMHQVATNNQVNAVLCGLFIAVQLTVLVFGIRTAWRARRNASPSANEAPYISVAQAGG